MATICLEKKKTSILDASIVHKTLKSAISFWAHLSSFSLKLPVIAASWKMGENPPNLHLESTRQADGLYALIHDLDQDGDLTMDELIRWVNTHGC